MNVGFFGGKFLPFHLGHVYAIMQASNYVDKLYVVLASNNEEDKKTCEISGIKFIPPEERLSWIGETLKDLDNIHILHVKDFGWEDTARTITDEIEETISYVFSSEKSYEHYFKKYYPLAEHIVIDNSRNTVSISATEIRQDIHKNWNMIPNCARPYFLKRVCIIGTESCGKSTLTKQLAKYFNTNYVHEVGRDYCEKYKNQLTKNHFDSIAMDHWRLQEKLGETANRILFIDSEAVITQLYLQMYGYDSSSLIEEIIKKQNYDLYLYLEPDVKWIDDGIRVNSSEKDRRENNIIFKEAFKQNGIQYISISGAYKERFNKAKYHVESLLMESLNE